MAQYTIKDLERLTGIKAHTIRIWEQRYGVLTPERTQTNIRRYSDEELKYLLNISQLLRHGGKISKLSKLSGDELARELDNLSQTVDKPEEYYAIHVDKLIIAMVELSEEKFEKVISQTSIKYGFEQTMLNVIIPFLTKVGLMWLTGEINVAQEHFISNLIRRKMIVAIDGLLLPAPGAKRYILFLPEGELHELGLLFSKYLIKSRGGQTLYLGQSVPLKDLVDASQVYNADCLVTFMTSPDTRENIKHHVDELTKLFADKKIMIAGAQVNFHEFNSYKNVQFMHRVTDLINVLDHK